VMGGLQEETQNARELKILCSAAELQGLGCSKDQALALDEFGHSFSIQLLIRKSFSKNQSCFLFFNGVFCPSENFKFSCFILSLPALFLKLFLTLVKSGSVCVFFPSSSYFGVYKEAVN